MKTVIGRTLVLLTLLSVSQTLHAQVKPQVDVNLLLGFPQGEFKEHVDQLGFGADIFAGIGLGRTPVVFGIEFGGMIYGYERRNEPFSTTIPDVTVDVETSNNILLGHFVLRLQPASGAVRPYIDGLFGVKYLFTETRIENEGFTGDEPIAVSTNFDDAALSYGAGGGIDIMIVRGRTSDGNKPFTLSINLGIRYLLGAEAEYLKEGSIRRESGRVSYDVKRSKTDLLLPQLGVRFYF